VVTCKIAVHDAQTFLSVKDSVDVKASTEGRQSTTGPAINSQLAAVLHQDDAQLTPPGVEEVN